VAGNAGVLSSWLFCIALHCIASASSLYAGLDCTADDDMVVELLHHGVS
jgi:hypothetical protein